MKRVMDLLISFLGILAIISMYAVVLLMVMRSVDKSVNKSIEKLRLSIKEDMRHLEESLMHSMK